MSRMQEAGGRQEVGGQAIGRAGRDKCIDLTDSRYLMPSVTVVYFGRVDYGPFLLVEH